MADPNKPDPQRPSAVLVLPEEARHKEKAQNRSLFANNESQISLVNPPPAVPKSQPPAIPAELRDHFVAQLVSMGFDVAMCSRAVDETRGEGVDAALNYLLNSPTSNPTPQTPHHVPNNIPPSMSSKGTPIPTTTATAPPPPLRDFSALRKGKQKEREAIRARMEEDKMARKLREGKLDASQTQDQAASVFAAAHTGPREENGMIELRIRFDDGRSFMAEFSHNDTIKDVLKRASDAEPTLQLTDEKQDEDGPEMSMQGGRTVRGNEEAQKAREVYLQQVAKMREEARKLYEEEEKRRKGLSMGPSGTMVSDNAGHAEPDDVDEYVWSLTTVFPKKTFGSEDDLAATLKQAGLRSKDSVFARRVTKTSLNREGSFGASARMHSSVDRVMEGAVESDDSDDEDMKEEHDEMSEGEDTTAAPWRSPRNSSHPLLDRLSAMGGHTLEETSATASEITETQNQPQPQAPAPALDQQSKQTTQQTTQQITPPRGGGRADHPLIARLAGAGSQAAQAAAPSLREENSSDSKMKDVVGSRPRRISPQQPSHPLLSRLDQAMRDVPPATDAAPVNPSPPTQPQDSEPVHSESPAKRRTPPRSHPLLDKLGASPSQVVATPPKPKQQPRSRMTEWMAKSSPSASTASTPHQKTAEEIEKERKDNVRRLKATKRMRDAEKEAIRLRYEEDKQNRKDRFAKIRGQLPSEASSSSQPAQTQDGAQSDQTTSDNNNSTVRPVQLMIRLPSGNSVTQAFQSDQTLADVRLHVLEVTDMDVDDIMFVLSFPRRTISSYEELAATSLTHAGLVPRGVVTVQSMSSRGQIVQGHDDPDDYEGPGEGDVFDEGMTYEEMLELESRMGKVSRGVKHSVFSTFKQIDYQEGCLPQNRSACAICVTDFAVGDKLRELPCSHPYHSECIWHWLRESSKCPQCTQDVNHIATTTSGEAEE